MKYRSTRFLPVLSSPLPNRTILFNSFLLHKLKLNHSPELSEAEFLEGLIHAPDSKGKKTFYAELFHPSWNCSAPGSGRHLTLPPFQMKGVGKTLPMNYDEYGELAGTMELPYAIRSFLISCLVDSTLMTGSALPVSVHQLREHKERGIYTRIMESPRLASIAPDMTDDEKKELREKLLKEFPGSSLREIQRIIISSYAALTFLTGTVNATPDNLLLDGKCLDEESLHWPRKYGEAILQFEKFTASGEIRTSSYCELRFSLSHLIRAFSYFSEESEVLKIDEAYQVFYEHLSALSGDPGLTDAWRKELKPEELEADGWSLSQKSLSDKITGLTLTKKLPVQTGPGADFNNETRVYLEDQLVKIRKLLQDSAGTLDATQFSNSLFTWVGQSAFVLPVRADSHGSLIANTMDLKEFWRFSLKKWPALSSDSIELIAWNGKRNRTLKPSESSSEDLIPLYLKSGSHVVHAFKTVIKGNRSEFDRNESH